MTDKEKLEALKAEIRKLHGNPYYMMAVKDVLGIIGSMQEEPVSEDLEEEIKRNVYDPFFDLNGVAIKGATGYLTVEDVADIARHFANWQKEQMTKNAVDAECDVILLEEGDELQYSVLYPKGKKPFNKGDKIKLIIVKED